MDPVFKVDRLPLSLSPDGSSIRELAGRSNAFSGHSLAIITHPVGTSSRAHHHSVSEEVYYLQAGTGRIQIDSHEYSIGPGDAIVLRPKQTHKISSDGPDHLVMLVSCAPAYSLDDVIWDE